MLRLDDVAERLKRQDHAPDPHADEDQLDRDVGQVVSAPDHTDEQHEDCRTNEIGCHITFSLNRRL